ncbi:hypothetical protein SS50377_24702 [Spironucleus salmonicida]|uniref:Uncharacterized protein n=1 Tax=Spironucleus salmonicida TaxID=348837 RepID=V6LJM7_9EUKA|nr:hypothetical protein SS50377_24702 [Spironucleus salmonicida]|eukprot:EST44583.1 Hypothetical protein SS50377_15587 [Spironucleus salmonicida]
MSLSQSSWNGAIFGNIQQSDKFTLMCGHGHLHQIALQQLRGCGLNKLNVSVTINVTSSSFNRQNFKKFVSNLIAQFQYQSVQTYPTYELSSFSTEFDSQ